MSTWSIPHLSCVVHSRPEAKVFAFFSFLFSFFFFFLQNPVLFRSPAKPPKPTVIPRRDQVIGLLGLHLLRSAVRRGLCCPTSLHLAGKYLRAGLPGSRVLWELSRVRCSPCQWRVFVGPLDARRKTRELLLVPLGLHSARTRHSAGAVGHISEALNAIF